MSVRIFISYAHDEYAYMDALRKRLQDTADGKTEIVTDEQIIPGQEWDAAIRNAMTQAHVVLFLVSKKFILSRYIKEVELQNAIERYGRGGVVLIPVLLESLDEEERKTFPLKKFEPLPVEDKKTKPVKEWASESEAYDNVASGVRRAVDNILLSKPYNAAVVKSLRDDYKKANHDLIFRKLERMEDFIQTLDTGFYETYLGLLADWRANKMHLIQRTKNAEEEKKDILHRVLGFMRELETSTQN